MTEKPAERKNRLKARAEKEAQRRADIQNGSIYIIDFQMKKIERLLETFASANIAPIPIAIAKADGLWTVDIHVKLKRVIEYEITSEHESLATAIAHAAHGLSNQSAILDRWNKDKQAFLLEV